MRDTRPTMKILLLQIQLMTRQFKHHYIRYCLSCLQVRESLLMTALEVIESRDVQAAAAYRQVLNEVNEWVETYNIKQSTKVTEETIEERDEQLHIY